MKRLLILLTFFLVAAQGFAQTGTYDRLWARYSLQLRDWRLDSVKRDTNFLNYTHSIPTADAIARYVAGRAAAPGRKETFTGSTSSSITLSQAPADTAATLVFLNGVLLHASDYSISGATLTLGFSRLSTDVVNVTYPLSSIVTGSTLPSQAGNAGKVLSTDGSSASWTGTATYSFSGLTNWDKLRYNSSSSQWVNFRPTYISPTHPSIKYQVKDTATGVEYYTDAPSGSGGSGIILRAAAAPTDGTTEYFNTLTHKLGVKNDEGTYWLYFTPSDSAAVTAPPLFLANFSGSSGTALSAYTPEYGSITSIGGSPTLDGSDHLTMPASSKFYVPVTGANHTLTLTYNSLTPNASVYTAVREVDGNNFIYVTLYLFSNGTDCQLSLNQYVGGVNTELYNSGTVTLSDTGMTLIITTNGSQVTATMGTVTSGIKTTTHTAAGNARVEVGATTSLNKLQID